MIETPVWTAPRTARLKELFDQGWTYSAMARDLGVTKWMVGDQMKKMGLRSRDRLTKTEPGLAPLAPELVMTSKIGCRYIAGDPHQVLRGIDPYCNAPRRPNSSWCDAHHTLACIRPTTGTSNRWSARASLGGRNGELSGRSFR